MNEFQLLIDLHKHQPRQGPGGEAETRLAMQLAGLDRSRHLKIADIGCGTGASAIQLAKELDAEVVAVDFLGEFLAVLEERAKEYGVLERIRPMKCSMDALPFGEGEFDVIWSEGAVYNMGFENGVKAWKKFLKPGGKLMVSEITWLTDERPNDLQAYWDDVYPEIDTASAKIGVLERAGYRLTGYFCLQSDCWLNNYYEPLQKRFKPFLSQYKNSDEAKAIVAADEEEIALYKKYCSYYSYGFYVAEKI
ncbi:class I SAM-dependent methyltransferase [Planctomycetota bacterium]|nr:class I SAM-dependent methyltransferase [Planctomycetota bacterium]